jgi:hypothetical protein
VIVNINTPVRVKLTDQGLSKLLTRRVPATSDENGFNQFQLWELFQIFGPHIYHGMPKPLFEGNDLYFNDDATPSSTEMETVEAPTFTITFEDSMWRHATNVSYPAPGVVTFKSSIGKRVRLLGAAVCVIEEGDSDGNQVD